MCMRARESEREVGWGGGGEVVRRERERMEWVGKNYHGINNRAASR